MAAASLIFLAAYGGMVSLAQVALYGVAGFTIGNLVAGRRRRRPRLEPLARRRRRDRRRDRGRPLLRRDRGRSDGDLLPHDHARLRACSSTTSSPRSPSSRASAAINSVDLARASSATRQRPGPALLRRARRRGRRLRRCSAYIVADAVRARAPGRARRPGPHARARLQRAAAPHARLRPRRLRRRPRRRAVRLVERPDRPGDRSTSQQTIDLLIIAVIGGLSRLEGAWVGALRVRR